MTMLPCVPNEIVKQQLGEKRTIRSDSHNNIERLSVDILAGDKQGKNVITLEQWMLGSSGKYTCTHAHHTRQKHTHTHITHTQI